MASTRQRRMLYSPPAVQRSKRICRCQARLNSHPLLCIDLQVPAFLHPQTTTLNKVHRSSHLHLNILNNHTGCRYNHRPRSWQPQGHCDRYQPTATHLPNSRLRKARCSLLLLWRMASLLTAWLVLGPRAARLYRKSMIRVHLRRRLLSVRSGLCLLRLARWRPVQVSSLLDIRGIYR